MEKARQHTAVAPGRKLRGFVRHLLAYFVASGLAFAVNIAVTPESTWFLLPVVGWGGVLALHVAYVMGLFDVFSNK